MSGRAGPNLTPATGRGAGGGRSPQKRPGGSPPRGTSGNPPLGSDARSSRHSSPKPVLPPGSAKSPQRTLEEWTVITREAKAIQSSLTHQSPPVLPTLDNLQKILKLIFIYQTLIAQCGRKIAPKDDEAPLAYMAELYRVALLKEPSDTAAASGSGAADASRVAAPAIKSAATGAGAAASPGTHIEREANIRRHGLALQHEVILLKEALKCGLDQDAVAFGTIITQHLQKLMP